ncbi:LysR substrate-binding domain-containing protein [Phyllobacterium sophorae]|uniref:LysR family transcriptional regulator n=1 Tax=Phyllobacterium sophorae TaxID=1520277 RepID=A0A2P7B7U7_9HYPH|nr:LysR substrate-binding domain-containing protein [Phyllobacterium sophorae]PSH62537.1 LysR family transcriptional regulator [Phyllobacterium sophorae]
MNFRQLEVLRTLLVTGSTTATARAMGLSQSGVSRLLQQLESDLSLQLFARDKGRLIPTPEAEKLAYDADLVLASIDRFSNLAQDLRSGAVGPESVRIALPHSLADHLTPALLADFDKAFPRVRIETFFDTSMRITRLVEQRTVDFGFLRYEGPQSAGVELDKIASGRKVCVIPKWHALADLATITPKDLRGVPLILIGRNRPNRMKLDEVFRRAGVPQNVKIETHSNNSAFAFAAHGLGVAIISSFFANLSKDPEVVVRPFDPPLTQEFGLAKAAGVPLSIAADALIKRLKQMLISMEHDTA